MQARRRLLRALGTVAAVAAAAAIGIVASPGGGRTIEAAIGGTLGAGGEFHSLAPSRIADSRENQQLSGRQPSAPLGSESIIDVTLSGRGGLPDFRDDDKDGFDDQVLAVVVTIAVIDPTQRGWLQAFPSGETPELTAVVNYRPGERVVNTAIIRPGQGGKMSMRMVTNGGVGSADLAIDVSGWFSTSQYETNGARVTPIEPVRIFDSREVAGAAPFGARSQRELQVRGARELGTTNVVVPSRDTITGVIVNVAGVNDLPGSTRTFVSLLPQATSGVVETSNLNLAPGDRRSNLSIVPVPADGTLTIYNHNGSVHVVIDVVGYLETGADPLTTAGRVVPLIKPFRAFDTREAEHFDQPLGPASAEDWDFDAFVADVKIGNDPVGPQSGLFGNLTATDLQPQYPWAPVRTYMVAYPSPAVRPGGPPVVANLNLGQGVAVPNLTLMRFGSTDTSENAVAVFNKNGYVDYILDVYAVVLE